MSNTETLFKPNTCSAPHVLLLQSYLHLHSSATADGWHIQPRCWTPFDKQHITPCLYFFVFLLCVWFSLFLLTGPKSTYTWPVQKMLQGSCLQSVSLAKWNVAVAVDPSWALCKNTNVPALQHQCLINSTWLLNHPLYPLTANPCVVYPGAITLLC